MAFWVAFGKDYVPFNERGEWVTLNPLQEYRARVLKSKEQPGSGGPIWTSRLRNEMHDNATLFVMEQEGIANTPKNFTMIRERIAEEVEEDYDASERDGFIKPQLLDALDEKPPAPYKRSGD